MRKVFVWVTFFCLLLATLFPVTSAAQTEAQSQGLSINPAILELILSPGEVVNDEVVVTNTTNIPIPIKGSVKNFIPNENLAEDDQNIFQAQSWFTLSEPDFILQPKQSKKITVTVTAPADASPGGHYATVFFQSLIPEEAVSSDSLYLTNRVGVLAFLVVRGDIAEHATIQDFNVPSLQQFGPVKFTLSLKNKGNVHLLPSGKMRIFDWRGKQIKEIPLRPGLILPNTSRNFEFIWDKPGLFGVYSAQVEVVYGSEQQKLVSSKVHVWIVPWLPIILGIIILGPLIWLIIKTRRRWRKAWRVLRGKEKEHIVPVVPRQSTKPPEIPRIPQNNTTRRDIIHKSKPRDL